MFWVSDFEAAVSEIERFLTGSVEAASSDRLLATILFSDIVGSTEKAAELGDGAWRQLLERHDLVVEKHVAEEGGRVIKSLGDGTLAVFDGPARAIRAAEAIREELRDLGLEIRAGVHTGECEVIGEDVSGMAVNIGARIGALAESGEVLVSSTVADLVVGSEMSFSARGEHELKGVPGHWRLLSVGDRPERPASLEPSAVKRDLTLSDKVALKLARRAPGPLRAMGELGRRAGRRRAESDRR
jgi:class 3 adenylate cyclase